MVLQNMIRSEISRRVFFAQLIRWNPTSLIQKLTRLLFSFLFPHRPIPGTYFNCIMFMVASSVVTTIMILNYHHRLADTHEMPNWVSL